MEGLKVKRRNRERTYDEKVANALVYLWKMSDYLCGKRLHVYLREIIPVLEKFNELSIEENKKS